MPAYFLLASLLPLLVVGTIAYQQARKILERDALDHLTTAATLKEDEIERWVSSVEQDVELLVRDPVLVDAAGVLLAEEPGSTSYQEADEILRKTVQELQRTKATLAEIMVVRSAGGEVVFSTNPEHEGRRWAAGSSFTTGPRATHVQNVYPSDTAGGWEMAIVTHLPVSADRALEAGEAVLAAQLDLAQLEEIMLQTAGLGASGETYLVDSSSRFVLPTRTDGEEIPASAGIDTALAERADGAGIYQNYDGVPVAGAYRWVDNRDMALLAEVTLHEALAPARTLALGILLAVVVAGVVVAGVGYGLARAISRPVLDLARTAARMAAGDLEQALVPGRELARRDEIGTLALAFDDMATHVGRLVRGLQERVAERTSELERRTVQLGIAADVGRAVASIPELDLFAQQVVDLVRDGFDLYYAGLFLVDHAGEQAVLEAGTGDPGRTMKKAGQRLAVGGPSMVGAACSTREAQIALNVRAPGTGPDGAGGLSGGVRFDNPLLPETRSEMALPLLAGERVLGALDVQSTRESGFVESDIAVLQLVADQVAVAVESARKVPAEGELVPGASPFYRMIQRLASSTTTEEVSAVVLETVAETEADGCAVGEFDLGFDGHARGLTFLGRWRRDALDSPNPDSPLNRAQEVPDLLWLQMSMAPDDVLPLPLFMTMTMIDDVQTDSRIPDASRSWLDEMGIRALAMVPLQIRSRAGEGPIGFVMIERDTPGAFSQASRRLYRAVADEAAVALERARLLELSEQRAWREHRIRDIGDRVTASFDLDQVLRATVEELGDLIGAAGGYVEMGPQLDPDGPARSKRAAGSDGEGTDAQ